MFKTPFSKVIFLIVPGIFIWHFAAHCWALEVSSEEYKIINEFETLNQTDPAAAKKFLTESLQSTRTPPLLYQAALLEVNHNRIDKAVEYFSEILKIDEKFPGAYLNRGRLYAMNGNSKLAVDDLMNGITMGGADRETKSILNHAYQQLDQPIAAELILRWAILSEPTDPNLHVSLGVNILQQGRYVEAEKIAETAIRLGAKDVTPWVIAANALIGQNDTEKAIDILESARLLLRDIPSDLLLTLGQLYLQHGLTDNAAQIFLQAHQKHSLNSNQLESLLESLLSLGDRDNATTFIALLRDSNPESPQTMYYSARTAEFTGDLDSALDYAVKATKLDSGFGKAFLLLGELHFKRKHYEDALNALRIARSFKDQQIAALRTELELWLDQENWSETLSILETLSQIDTNTNWDGLIGSVLDLIHQQE